VLLYITTGFEEQGSVLENCEMHTVLFVTYTVDSKKTAIYYSHLPPVNNTQAMINISVLCCSAYHHCAQRYMYAQFGS